MSVSLNSTIRCPVDGLNNELTITTEGHQDGLGAAFVAMIQVYAFSLHMNQTYCSLRWRRLGHDVDAGRAYDFIGGQYYGPIANNETPRKRDARHFFRNLPKQGFDLLLRARDDVRKYYHMHNKSGMDWYTDYKCHNGDTKHVALHIRRGDVNRNSGKRWLNDSMTLQCADHVLNETKTAYSGCIQLHIMSEGKKEDFTAFEHLHPVYHLSMDALVTFHHMVIADILILSWSTYAYAAGYINGKRLYSADGSDKHNNMYFGFSSKCIL